MGTQSEFLINGTPLVLELDMTALARERHISVNRRHCNAEYEVTLILQGSCQADVEDDRCILRAGQGVVIAPGRYHILQALPGEFERFCFRFILPRSELADCVRRQLLSHRFFDLTGEMMHLCRSILQTFDVTLPYWESLQFTLLKALLLYILRLLGLGDEDHLLKKSRFIPTRSYQIDRYIEAHLADSPSIKDLAQSMNLSCRQTMRVLQDTCGMSFREKLISARMDRAAWLLRTTQKPLDTIISEVGYSSQSAFHQAFRTHFRTTPLRYRKQFAPASRP